MKWSILIAVCYLMGRSFGYGQQMMTAEELIQKSIAFHDPTDNWPKFRDTISFKMETEENAFSKRKVYFDNKNGRFIMWATYEDGELSYDVGRKNIEIKWNGKNEIPKEVRGKYKLSESRAEMYRNYYLYLCGMPMKLQDPGSIPGKVELVDAMYGKNKNILKLEMNYTPEVGTDKWHFYFDSKTFELLGYDFYKKEKGDGEYIILKDLEEKNEIKFSKYRDWYISKSGKFLGRDIIE